MPQQRPRAEGFIWQGNASHGAERISFEVGPSSRKDDGLSAAMRVMPTRDELCGFSEWLASSGFEGDCALSAKPHLVSGC